MPAGITDDLVKIMVPDAAAEVMETELMGNGHRGQGGEHHRNFEQNHEVELGRYERVQHGQKRIGREGRHCTSPTFGASDPENSPKGLSATRQGAHESAWAEGQGSSMRSAPAAKSRQ